MNRKRTNYLVAILNAIVVVSIYVLYFSKDFLFFSTISISGEIKSIYDNFIINLLINHMQLIMILVYSGVGILNIICAIQNRKNKKLCFWLIIFGIYAIYGIGSSIIKNVSSINLDFIEWTDRIIYGIIPIILAIKNLIFIRKNRPKRIQVISYVVVIIIGILNLLDILEADWHIIAIIMQFIYIYGQEEYIEDTKTRKIVNVILYYILQSILSIGFIFIIIYSLIATKINEVKWENQLSEIYNDITMLQGITNKELYIPVEKNEKYGFINESGEEKIPCEFDRVTYFFETELNNQTCYFAFAKKDNEYYIISKNNQSIYISENTYLKNIDNLSASYLENFYNKEQYTKFAYMSIFQVVFEGFTRYNLELEIQTKTENTSNNEINLQEQNSKYYYNNQNYTMILEPIEDEEDNDDDDYYFDLISYSKPKFNVTIRKNNGEESFYVEYIPEYNEYDNSIAVFSDGSIAFESLDGEIQGWYNNNGDKISVLTDYNIMDVNDNHIILWNYDEDYKNYFILDLTGKTLLKTDALAILDDIYLIRNENKKMVLYDKYLNKISNEYDKIIANNEIDISQNFSSYY